MKRLQILLVALTLGAATHLSAQGLDLGFKSNAELREQGATTTQTEAPQTPPTQPILRAELAETSVVPGQSTLLRLTILVPTYMPSPPEFPSFNQPNLVVELPERATGPTTQTVGGESWSGVTRRYQVTPLVPGTFTIQPADVGITWADPDTNAPTQSVLTLDPLTLNAALPQGAEGLDPFIAAESLTLTQQIEGAEAELTPGDSLTREITAEITGGTALVLPTMAPSTALPGLAAYPETPSVQTTGPSAGLRRERIVYVAEGGGSGALPEIHIDWFNTATGKVETASLESVPYKVDGPLLAPAGDKLQSRPWLWVGIAGVVLVLSILTLWVLRLHRRRKDRPPPPPTEASTFRALENAVRAQDLGLTYAALDAWAALLPGDDPRRNTELSAALATIGAARYGTTSIPVAAAWQDLSRALSKARASAKRRVDRAFGLPPLNPRAL